MDGLASKPLDHLLATALIKLSQSIIKVLGAICLTLYGFQPSLAAKVSSKDEYRKCLNFADALKLVRAQVDQDLIDTKAQKIAIQNQQEVIAKEGAALDVNDPLQVEKHNLKIDDANKTAVAFNVSVEQANVRKAKFNDEADRYNKECGSLAVKASDKAAVVKERTSERTNERTSERTSEREKEREKK